MKSKITRKATICLTLDSSEMVMFNQGGKHKIDLTVVDLHAITNADSVEISVQMERESKAMFDHTYGQAQIHKASR